MKLLVYGSKGWIGSQFVEILKSKDISFVNGKSRANNLISLRNEVREVNPTHIISFIGRTHGKIGDKVYSDRKSVV